MNTDNGGKSPDSDGLGEESIKVKKEETEETEETEENEETVHGSDYCSFCEIDPCIITELDDMLNEILMEYRDSKKNRQIRYIMYTESIRYIHGYLRKGNRKKVPKCLEKRIHSLAPDKEYTGFIPSVEQTE